MIRLIGELILCAAVAFGIATIIVLVLIATDPDGKVPLPRRRRPHPAIAPTRQAARMVIEECSEAEKHLLWLFRHTPLELEQVKRDYAAGAISQDEMEKRVEVCLLREELGSVVTPALAAELRLEEAYESVGFAPRRTFGRNVPTITPRGMDWTREGR